MAGARCTSEELDALPVFELILKYYRIICSYSNRQIMKNNYRWERTYINWLTQISDLPRGYFKKLVKEESSFPVYTLILNSDGGAKISVHYVELNKVSLSNLQKYLDKIHQAFPALRKRIVSLLKVT